MYHQNHVRRSHINHSQRYPDTRMSSNPQTVPRSHAPMQRGSSVQPNYPPYNAMGQSPQHAQYVATGPYSTINPDGSTTHNQMASGKSHPNGNNFWGSQQRMHYPAHTQQSQAQFSTYAQSTTNMMTSSTPQLLYVPPPGHQPVRTRYSTSHPAPPHSQLPPGTPTYFQAPAPFIANQFSQHYGQPYDPMYQANSQQNIQPSVVPHQPAQSVPAPKKKMITIKDPATMEDVTTDVLRSGKRTESESSSQPRASPTNIVHSQSQPGQIVAKFAAQVAAAATENDDQTPRQMAPSAEVNSIIPSGIDTSVPPPSLQSISHTLQAPAAVPDLPNAAQVNHQPASIDLPNGGHSTLVANSAEFSPRILTKSALSPDAPVAVVQPLVSPPSNPPAAACDVDSSEVAVQPLPKVEKILSRHEALSSLKDSQSIVTNEQLVAKVETPDVAAEKLADPEAAKPEPPPVADVVESDISPAVADKEDGVERTSSEVAPADLAVPTPTPEQDAPEIADNATVDSNAAIDAEHADAADQQPAGGATAPTEAVESSGDSSLNENKEKVVPTQTPAVPEKNVAPINSHGSQDLSKDKDDASDNVEAEVFDSESLSSSKKVYDRDFLMRCRSHDSTREKPTGLPDIEIIMEKCLPQIPTGLPSLSPNYGNADFTPGWMARGPRTERQTSRGSQGGGQPRQGYGYSHQMGQQKVIKKVSIQREPEPELNKAENAWKPSKLEAKSVSAEATEEEKTEEILKSVRAILNKLTPQKFSELMKKFMQLPINTESRLRDAINLIFEKAIDEPSFCEAYANMCRVMSQHSVMTPSSSDDSVQGAASPVVFRKVLLTRCQKEFEKDRSSETALDELRKKMEEAKTPEEKQQLKEELEFKGNKARRRTLGNIRFIGELFKLQMLTEAIMHNCIMALFRAHDGESLEALCRLLTTIGRALDHVKGKHLMDQYFSQIDKIIAEKKVISRVKFMLKDVIDLRKNNWVQRAIKAQGPKTIEQIHQDAKDEKEQQALKAAAAAAGPPMKSQSRGNRMGSRNSSSHNLSEDGWTNVQQKPMRIDPQKMKFSKEHSKIDENISLVPNRGKQVWKSGSGSITKSGSGSFSYRDHSDNVASRSTPSTRNRFSALVHGAGGSESHMSNRTPGRVSSQERTKTGSRGAGESRSHGREERQNALDTVRRLTSAERKPRGAPPAAKPASTPAPEPKLDPAAISKRIESTVKEYMHLNDIKEASECFEELKIPTSMRHVIAKVCLETSLERSSKDRASVSRLLAALVRTDRLPVDQLVKGVVDNMELAADLELDLPKVWSCVAEQVVGVFYMSDGKVALHRLKEMAAPLLQLSKSSIFVAELLKRLVEQTDLDRALQEWKNSNLTFEHFLRTTDPGTLAEYLDKHELRAFHGVGERPEGGAVTFASSQRLDFDELVTEVTKQLDLHEDDDSIFDWVETNIGPEERASHHFVKALTTAVCNKAIVQGDNKLEVVKSQITSRSILLRKFVDDEGKELQAVYALQQLFVHLDQPPNVLKLLFDFLYDVDVISEQTFFKWEKSDDSSEGKGVALCSVNPFLTWLRQADVESDE